MPQDFQLDNMLPIIGPLIAKVIATITAFGIACFLLTLKINRKRRSRRF